MKKIIPTLFLSFASVVLAQNDPAQLKVINDKKIAAYESNYPKLKIVGQVRGALKTPEGVVLIVFGRAGTLPCYTIGCHDGWLAVRNPETAYVEPLTLDSYPYNWTGMGPTFFGQAYFYGPESNGSKQFPNPDTGRMASLPIYDEKTPKAMTALYAERDRLAEALKAKGINPKTGATRASEAKLANDEKHRAEEQQRWADQRHQELAEEAKNAAQAEYDAAEKVGVEGRFEDSDERRNGDLTLVIAGSKRTLIALRKEDLRRFPDLRNLMGKKVRVTAFSCDRSYPCLHQIEPAE